MFAIKIFAALSPNSFSDGFGDSTCGVLCFESFCDVMSYLIVGSVARVVGGRLHHGEVMTLADSMTQSRRQVVKL
jgi:hypothetical protein